MTHSVMFHHFHDETHQPSQGSLSTDDFRDMLVWLSKKYTLLSATEYTSRLSSGTLNETDICLSFDDALKCQYDIVIPTLDEFDLNAFFFVYSSVFSDTPDFLEIYRYFRTTGFESIDEFYKEFFRIVEVSDADSYKKHSQRYPELDYLSEFPFYSENDKWFRYLRDQYLGPVRYHDVMNGMITIKKFDVDMAKEKLWMLESDLKNIQTKGHKIGLHSFSHPTQMSKLSKEEQTTEYRKNYDHLYKIINSPIEVMSHPCGDYNQVTLEILTTMGIKMGFRSNMAVPEIKTSLEIPREDHANVFKEMHS